MRVVLAFVSGMITLAAIAQEMDHSGHNMSADSSGVVMNENHETLPEGCDAISGDEEFTIRAGRAYADDEHGTTFGLSDPEVRVAPCSRVTIDFVNEDDVRHQWMVHGLPKYLYPTGMFHIEAMGGQSQSGTFIVPPEDRNYLIHCDMSQHMEKGMRGQLVVGRGSGDLWSVPGVSDAFYRAPYRDGSEMRFIVIAMLIAFIATIVVVRRLQ